MKVMIVMASLHGGGAEYVARTWMAWLAREGHDVTGVLTGKPVDASFIPEGVSVQSLSAHSSQGSKIRALRAALRDDKPDVALSLQMHSNLTLMAAARLIATKTRPAICVSERNLVTLGLPGSGLTHRTKVAIAKHAYRHADGILAISHPVAAELVAGFGVKPEQIFVVPNPATAKVVTGPTFEEPAKRPAIPNEGAPLQIVLPCRLVRQKRPELALRTAAVLAARGVAVEVVSYGDGPLLREMETRAAQLGVEFVQKGWVEQWYAEHRNGRSVVLLPSIREGLGNVLVEATAAGVPTVAASGALGVADAIVPGMTGELSLTSDPSDFADAVLDASQIQIQGVEPWLARFSEETSGQLLESTLLRLVSVPG